MKIVDNQSNPVSNVIVIGTFAGAFNETGLGVSAEDGLTAVATLGIKKGNASHQFCVDDALDAALVPIYNPAAKVETCDSF